MNKKIAQNILWFISGVLCTLIIVFSWLSATQYERDLHGLFSTQITYQETGIQGSLSADYWGLLKHPKRTFYFGALPDEEESITVNISYRAILTIYPKDKNSVILKYEPHNENIWPFSYTYKLTGYGNYNQHLEELYRIFEDEAFNKTIDLPEAE
ncbi:MAG: hypothetical protein IJ333_09850 [Clostridia bacterium]|nr:hypothetical protein [Clostridia bacterium]